MSHVGGLEWLCRNRENIIEHRRSGQRKNNAGETASFWPKKKLHPDIATLLRAAE